MILDLIEEGIAAGKGVLEVLGADVTAFTPAGVSSVVFTGLAALRAARRPVPAAPCPAAPWSAWSPPAADGPVPGRPGANAPRWPTLQ
ncbi:hypothetical protein [Streptomyces sp. SCL15-4]|uniref:hypothetical protein n=1 Tax=Streptomyces sp. SCL15-4 TaxID=2967221 RepID=UPI002967772E|nr:hypothetical protein [Streptomyces sp. SCL15-4]